MDTGKAALGGLDGNLAAALGYPIGIIAILSVFMEKDNKFVRFHAFQSLFLIVGYIVLMIALVIITVILTAVVGGAASAAGSAGGGIAASLIGLIWILIMMILPLVFLAVLIFAAVKAYGGNMFKFPVIGNIAEGMANK